MEDLHCLFDAVYDEVMALPNEPLAGLNYWRVRKLCFSSIPLSDLKWFCESNKDFDPSDETGEYIINDDGISMATPLHFTNQLKRIPILNAPSERKIMQMALNVAQAIRSGQEDYFYLSTFSNVVRPKS